MSYYKRHILQDKPSRPDSDRYWTLCGNVVLTMPRERQRTVSWENARPSSKTVCKSCLISKQKMVRERRRLDGGGYTDLRDSLLKIRDDLNTKQRR